MAIRLEMEVVWDLLGRIIRMQFPAAVGRRENIPMYFVVANDTIKALVVGKEGETEFQVRQAAEHVQQTLPTMDGLAVANQIFAAVLKTHLGLESIEDLQFEEGGGWIEWLQHVEALLAYAEDYDEGDDPDAILREAVAGVSMTVELLCNKRKPKVDIESLLKQLRQRATSKP
jgi:hypothetical protein